MALMRVSLQGVGATQAAQGANGKAAMPTTGGYHGALRAELPESEASKKMLPELVRQRWESCLVFDWCNLASLDECTEVVYRAFDLRVGQLALVRLHFARAFQDNFDHLRLCEFL